jgi:hypothetical protein
MSKQRPGPRRPTGPDRPPAARLESLAARPPAPTPPPPARLAGRKVAFHRVGPHAGELVHPACVEEVWPDYEDALEAWRQDEPEEAREALRFALEGCGEFHWVHVALGGLALAAGDLRLARGHFGYALERCRAAIPADFRGALPPELPGNWPFHRAAEALLDLARHERGGDEVRELETLLTLARGGPSGPTTTPPRHPPL